MGNIAGKPTQAPINMNNMSSGSSMDQNPSGSPGLKTPNQPNAFGGTTGGNAKPPLSFKQAYPAAIEQTGEDYSNIMGNYQKLLANLTSGATSPLNNTPKVTANNASASTMNPTMQNYITDPSVTSSIANLGELSNTGGYSPQGIADLRARGIAPIRSVYANAMQEMDRNRSLQGGYSPNFNAASAKMARELSDKISGATQDVNAGIAQNVASNRLSAAPSYANAAATSGAAQNAVGANNAGAMNRAGEFNAGNATSVNLANAAAANRAGEFNATNQVNQNQLVQDAINKALAGMTSLYGTTPALANTFGNQAAQAAQIKQGATSANNSAGLGLINSTMNARTPTQSPIVKTPTSLPFKGPTGPPLGMPWWATNTPSYG